MQNVSTTTIEKQVGSSIPKVGTTTVAIDNHMAVIQIQIGKNTIEEVLLDGIFRVNIIVEQLRLKLGVPKPKLAPCNLRMANQITTKLVGLIRNLKIYGIIFGLLTSFPYIIMFTILQNSVVDFSYSMLSGRPWLRDAKVAHDQGNNTITIQGNGTFRTIILTKHLGNEVKRPKML